MNDALFIFAHDWIDDFFCCHESCDHQNFHSGQKPMKVEVTFYVGGRTWIETYVVNALQAARRTGEPRNPTTKIVALNPVY